MHPQSRSDMEQMRQLHLSTALHALHGAAVDACRVGERLLGHPEPASAHADAVTDSLAGVEDPLRLIGWHPSNALPIMIISQQQI